MQKTANKLGLVLSCLVFFVTTAVTSVGAASPDDAARTLGFESVADWSIPEGAGTLSASDQRTQGIASLAVSSSGWTVVRSRLIGPLGQIFPQFTFDLRLPDDANAPNLWWAGEVQLTVSAPSIGIWGQWLATFPLTGLSTSVFHSLSVNLPPDLVAKLSSQTYYDLTFSLSFSVPQGVMGQYLIDNLHVASALPPNSTIGVADLLPILDFEQEDRWSFSGGEFLGLSATRSHGNFSLAVQPGTWAELVSVPMVSIAPIDEVISLDLAMPSQPAPGGWLGTVSLYVDAPSAAVWGQYLGQHELTPLAPGIFHRLAFSVSQGLRTALNGSYSDLRFRLTFSVPQGSGVFLVDNLQVGPITTPPEIDPVDLRMDIVGTGTSGVASVSLEDVGSASPAVPESAFQIKAEDQGCVPSASVACRYVVHVLRARLGGFSLGDSSFSTATFYAVKPFRVVIGGSFGMSAPIPPNVPFAIAASGEQDLVMGVTANNQSTISINPSGAGLIAVSAHFQGRVEGKSFSTSLVISADTPLVNRPPLANAGPDQSVSSASECRLLVNLDASASTDPEGNIGEVRWLASNNVQAGIGLSSPVLIRGSGSHVFTVVIRDTFGAIATDDVVVNASLPAGCPQ